MVTTRGIGERGEAGRRAAVQGDARDPPLAVADHDRPPGPQFGGGTLATDGGGLAEVGRAGGGGAVHLKPYGGRWRLNQSTRTGDTVLQAGAQCGCLAVA